MDMKYSYNANRMDSIIIQLKEGKRSMDVKQLMRVDQKPAKAGLSTYTLRLSRDLLDKLHYVADYEGRSANMEIIQLIKKHIAEFEQNHGEIKIK